MRTSPTVLGSRGRIAVAAAGSVVLAAGLVPAVVASAAVDRAGPAQAIGHADTPAHPATSGLAARGIRDVDVRWRPVASGFASPTQVTSAPDGTKRLFVVQKGGQVRIVRNGQIVGKPYIAIGRRVATAGEGGLLSVAFSPTFRRDHLLWVAYARASDGDLVVARMQARGAGAAHVSSKTLKPVLRVEHSREDNHYGGQLAFGPGRKLFIGVGDGGGGGDPFNLAQDRDSLLGKILRIDPYQRCRGRGYCVPDGNPFAGKKGRDEIWLMGVRNPWRFSVDPRSDDLWIGDVGQEAVEEVDRVGPHPQRINLGWSCWEGRQRYNPSRCRAKVDYVFPRVVVAHPAAESITGGFVYRGHRYAKQIGGAYVFADFISHRVWLYKAGVGKVPQAQRLNGGPTSFGVDDRGEIYAVTYDGVLHRMRVVRG
jgi:glucose/arabinose dehydrogenase